MPHTISIINVHPIKSRAVVGRSTGVYNSWIKATLSAKLKGAFVRGVLPKKAAMLNTLGVSKALRKVIVSIGGDVRKLTAVVRSVCH
jgi:hypothetical protein